VVQDRILLPYGTCLSYKRIGFTWRILKLVELVSKSMKTHVLASVAGVLLVLQMNAVRTHGAGDGKINPEELIKRHLASIGTAKALAAARTRVARGTVQVGFRLGNLGRMNGNASIVSEREKSRIDMMFNSIQYPGDQLAYDGDDVTTGFVSPGLRSQFSRFVFTHGLLLREGLLGGTTTTAWALLNVAQHQPKLKYTGLRKVEGKLQHELSYRARKGAGDLQIWLYFDPETFRHTFSLYKLVRMANMATEITGSPYQRDSVYKILEEFSDFREVDGLALPHTYKITFSVEGEPTILHDWLVSINEVRHNIPLEPDTFVVR
jgi:hypothetical protein